jgi:uncharacterized membrane protein
MLASACLFLELAVLAVYPRKQNVEPNLSFAQCFSYLIFAWISMLFVSKFPLSNDAVLVFLMHGDAFRKHVTILAHVKDVTCWAVSGVQEVGGRVQSMSVQPSYRK